MNSRKDFQIYVIVKFRGEVSTQVMLHLLSLGFIEKDQHTWAGSLDSDTYVWLLRYADEKSLVVSIGNGFKR